MVNFIFSVSRKLFRTSHFLQIVFCKAFGKQDKIKLVNLNSPTPRPFLALPSRAGTLFLPCRQGRNIKSEHFSEHTFLIFFQNMLQSEQKYSTESKFLVNNWVGSRPLGFFLQNWHTAGDFETCKKRQINYFFFFQKLQLESNWKKCDFFKN